MTCPLCGAQNNPGVAACYNCGGALTQTFAQPQQQWAQQPAQPQQQWAQQPAQPQQQWAQQPASGMTPDAGMGFSGSDFGGGAAQPSSWDTGMSYDYSGHGGGGKGLKIVAISVVGVLLLGGGTLATLWATGVIWSGSEVEGRWTDSEGGLVEFQEDGDIIVEEMSSMGVQMKWEQEGDEMTWTMKPDSRGTPMFECDDGDTIPLDFVNDYDYDCDEGEDEDVSQSVIDSRTVYEDSEMGYNAVFDLRFEVVEDVMFIKMNSVKYEFDGETEQEDGDGECIVFVRREVADTHDEWNDAISNVKIPNWCDSVEDFVDENGNQGPEFYSFQFTPIDDGNGETYSKLLYITLSSAPTSEELNIYDSQIIISVDGDVPYSCQEDELAEYCYWERQYSTDDGDSIWDEDETFEIYRGEDMDGDCSGGCAIQISIVNIEGMTIATGQVTLN